MMALEIAVLVAFVSWVIVYGWFAPAYLRVIYRKRIVVPFVVAVGGAMTVNLLEVTIYAYALWVQRTDTTEAIALATVPIALLIKVILYGIVSWYIRKEQ